MPMCREPHTMRSPGCGVEPAGSARPVRCAHEETALTEPKPCPCSPSGMPPFAAVHEAKNAHQGPTPEPAVALRYWAMRGESLEPGGCSVCPTSADAAWSMACTPAPPAPGAAVNAAEAMAGVALAGATAAVCAPSTEENEVEAGACTGAGTSAVSICAMRARTSWTLIHREGRTIARGL